jgi:hypothetical protein
MKKCFLILLLTSTIQASSQSLQQLYASSKKAYEAKDYRSFLQQSKELDSLRPSHPAFTYNLATAYALTGNQEMALSILKKAILMNSMVEFENVEDFQSLAKNPKYAELIQLKSDLRQPVLNSEKVISLSEKNLHPEGLVFLRKSKTWLASSIRNRKIVSFDETGKTSDWLIDDTMFSVFAMKPDTREKYLWAATSAMPEMKGFVKETDGKAAILKINIASGKTEGKYEVGGNHVFGDLLVSKNDAAYVSDSANPKLYKIDNDKMTEWLDLGKEAFNLQGMAFNADESKMYVADYLKGILVIPMRNMANRYWLKFPESATVKGIDGLVFYKNSLVAVHNGVAPIRLVRYFLNDKDEIVSHKVLDHNRAEFDEPALAAIKDNYLYFFANSPWKAYGKDFELNESKFVAPMLFRLELD